MELATPPPAARAPVAWYSWWLMPLALGAGTVTAVVVGPDQTQIPATFAGAAATAASAVCVRLLVRAQLQLRRNSGDFRASQSELTQQWQQHASGLERKFAAEHSAWEAQLTEQAQTYEARLAEETHALEARLAEDTHTYEARLAEEAHTYEARLAQQMEAYEARIAEQTAASESTLAAQTEVWQEQLAGQRAAVALLADEQLPEALKRLRAGDAIDDLLPSVTQCAEVGPDLQAELRKVLRTALIGVEREFDRSTSAEQAVISIGSRIHVLTSKLRGRLHEMQGEHGRLPAVAQGLMELDQEIGPADRLAASIGVLGGSDRPGRQWQEPQRLLSVVRGGIGRIKDFDRVQVRHLPELGVDGGLVDHLTLIFAHLLDNAARYSPPTEPVVVSGKEVPNGVGIEIQDAGKGLSEEKKQEAAQALEGTAAGPGLGGVSEDANLGLRVVGSLARRYGIRVTFADSPWLGTSVVVVVPHKYFSQLPAAVTEPALAAAVTREPVEAEPEASAEEAVDTTPGGLPRRRSRRNDPATPSARPAAAEREETVAAVPPDASFTGLAAFATAGRESGPPHATTTDREPAAVGENTADREPAALGDTTADRERTGSGETTAGREFNEHRTEESD
ncbi:ATP-binding protein [Streptomyces sp. NBC_00554]|uniref:ATP-binding protein n=1 Tax=unclassified Streptomyces TaxID=2593676 RepID=UPI00324364B9|nr:ATP-binding protein [Streptomyces sp. NBC_00554]